jgi:hypothetical protein
MSGFDRLERELESAAARRSEASWARRMRSAGGTAAIAAGLATVLVIAVAAVALLHGHAAPSPTNSSTPAGSAQPAPAAAAAAWARLLRCPGQGHGKRLASPTIVSGAAPEPQLVAALGVLRGPWTAADAPPAGTTCKSVSALLTAQRLDFRYVRYVGPGLGGGEVFLVPATLTIRLPRRFSNIPLPRGSQLATACLLTVGASARASPQRLGGCQILSQINRPPSETVTLMAPSPLPLSVLRLACAHVKPASTRLKCLATPRLVHFPAIQQVVSGVVRDGIVSLDVYTRGKGGARKLVSEVPVDNNVYSFQTGGAVSGLLILAFKDAGGQTVQTTPTRVGTSNSVVGTTPAETSGQATIPLVSRPPSSG